MGVISQPPSITTDFTQFRYLLVLNTSADFTLVYIAVYRPILWEGKDCKA